ncbi:MAG: hypothetical protein FJ279_36220 [Planctomycetes bacterium]|nr:hypothetical protein [Planctomycetota bacterium]
MVNLVLICSDTFRWDYLGCYGNSWIKTPSLDKLAAESAIFLDAYAEGLPTIPVRRVLLTGRRIFPFDYHEQKSDMVKLEGWHPLFFEDVTLAETLKEQGYTTSFVTDVYHLMKPGKNFHRGFDHWYWVRGVEADPYHIRDQRQVQHLLDQIIGIGKLPKDHWIIQHMMGRKDWKKDADSLVARVMTRAAQWLRNYTLDAPFFLYVDSFDPHEPWDPPEEYAQRYSPTYRGVAGAMPPGLTKPLTPQQVEHVKAAYAGEVTMTDRWIGHLLDTLRDLKRLDDTIIVFTSDHGCMMGEQGELHKGADRLRNQVTQVPLIIRHPKRQAAGNRVSGFVQHQDIMPTALNLLGAKIPGRVQGEDLWPMALDQRQSARERIVTAFGRFASVRTRKWNYVTNWAALPQGHRGRVELYDLEADPKELVNIIGQHSDVAAELDAFLKAYVREHAAETRGTLGPGQPVPLADQARL